MRYGNYYVKHLQAGKFVDVSFGLVPCELELAVVLREETSHTRPVEEIVEVLWFRWAIPHFHMYCTNSS